MVKLDAAAGKRLYGQIAGDFLSRIAEICSVVAKGIDPDYERTSQAWPKRVSAFEIRAAIGGPDAVAMSDISLHTLWWFAIGRKRTARETGTREGRLRAA